MTIQHPPPTRPPAENLPTTNQPTRPSLHLEVEEWLPYLDDPDASDEEKLALIETLWGIVLSFVDLGWTVEAETGEKSNLPPAIDAPSIDLSRALHAAVVQLDQPNIGHQEKEEV